MPVRASDDVKIREAEAHLRYDGAFKDIKIVSEDQLGVGVSRSTQRVVDSPLETVAFFTKQRAMPDDQRAKRRAHLSAFSDLWIEPAVS